MPAIRAAHFDDLLLGVEKMPAKTVSDKVGDTVTEKPNPDYLSWVTRDQALLGYLFSSLTREVLQCVTMLTTSVPGLHESWAYYRGPVQLYHRMIFVLTLV
jgi:hypothetical protein